MPSPLTLGLSGNYKSMLAQHRQWYCGVLGNGESWPRVIPGNIVTSADIYRLGIIPTYSLVAPTTVAGTSTPLSFGICLVYRSTLFNDGLSGANIQGNRSNIVDIDLSAGTLAAVLTKVTSSDTKINALDIYAAQKIGSAYGTFYRVVKTAANTAGTVTFSIVLSNGVLTGAGVTNGTADTTGLILATDNDYPYAAPILKEVAGRLISAGGIVKRVTATLTNGSGTITTTETLYDGIEFWYFKLDTDTTGGVDGRGSYLCRYAGANSVTLVAVDGTATTYTGTTGSGTASIWPPPNRRYSKLLNPHCFPQDNVDNDYPSAILAGEKVPNSNRLLLTGANWTIAEDYDRLPMEDGLNYISTEYGCSSPFSMVAAHGRLYWLDLSRGKRELVMSDGSSVVPISTAKIKSILQRVTLDSNLDVYHVGFIHGAYFDNEDTIRWALYLDNNTVPNYILEFDLNMGDVRGDPTFYTHRYQDVYTYGKIRGRVYIGQYGWTGGIARIGQDNVSQRYVDWVPSGTLSGSLDSAGQTTTVLTVTGATFYTTGDGLKGIQLMVWQENDSGGNLIANPTFYHCRISANTATTITINYVETMDVTGLVSAVGTALPSAPSGTGWQYAIGVIQAFAGPKWFVAPDSEPATSFRELSVNHEGQDLTSAQRPVRVHFFENFDTQPRDAQYLEPSSQGDQVASTSKSASSFVRPKTNPVGIAGFQLMDNNVNTDTTALNVETITLDFNQSTDQGDGSPKI